jgi:hypothetical protein
MMIDALEWEGATGWQVGLRNTFCLTLKLRSMSFLPTELIRDT